MLNNMLYQAQKDSPQKIAVVDGQQRVSFSELYMHVCAFSAGLYSVHVRSADTIAVLLPNCLEFAISFFAIARQHAIVYPLNPALTDEEIMRCFEHATVTAIITDAEHIPLCQRIAESMQSAITLISIDQPASNDVIYFRNLFIHVETSHAPIPTHDRVLYHYSSGSTGQSKFIYRTHEQLFYEASNFAQTIRCTPHDCILCIVPLFHAHGLGNCLLAAIYNQITLIILERIAPDETLNVSSLPFASRSSRVLELIEQEKVTIFPGVPYIFEALAESPQHPQRDCTSLRICFSAASTLSTQIFNRFMQRFKLPILNLYGCTEAGSVTINLTPGTTFMPEAVGHPLCNIDIKIVNEDFHELPPGHIGEIAIKSPAMTTGYCNQPELNRQVFKNGFFLIGDRGQKDATGALFLAGRKMNFIDTCGYKVDPLEVENVLKLHPAVAEAVALGIAVSSGEQLVKAVIVLKQAVKKHELFLWCQSRLANFKIPRIIEIRTELPRNSVGKVLYKDLIQSADQQTQQEGLVRQQFLAETQSRQRRYFLETYLGELCSRLFSINTTQIEVQQPFGSFGLNSISALEIRTCLEIDFELTLSSTLLWSYPTITELAAFLQEQLEQAETPSTLLSTSDDLNIPSEEESMFQQEAQIEALSDEEAHRLLSALVEKEIDENE